MAPSATVTRLAARGFRAGPAVGAPSVIENMLPWQGHSIDPDETLDTVQPWWVQVVSKAFQTPADGWVTTTCCSPKIFPVPTGMSAVRASCPAPAWGLCGAWSPRGVAVPGACSAGSGAAAVGVAAGGNWGPP